MSAHAITLTLDPQIKKRVEKEAHKENKSVPDLLKEIVATEMAKRDEDEQATAAALAAFRKFAGSISVDPITSEEIDRIVYGEDFGKGRE